MENVVVLNRIGECVCPICHGKQIGFYSTNEVEFLRCVECNYYAYRKYFTEPADKNLQYVFLQSERKRGAEAYSRANHTVILGPYKTVSTNARYLAFEDAHGNFFRLKKENGEILFAKETFDHMTVSAYNEIDFTEYDEIYMESDIIEL